MEKDEYVLRMNNISKSFPGVRALKGVNLNVKYGEVVALCGENGAGKSTLMKVLSGVYQADEGSGDIIYQGRKVCYTNPNDAKKDGIVLVFQELSLIKDLSVAENIFLGSLPMKNRRVDWDKLYKDAQTALDELNCHISAKTTVDALPIAQQQMVEITRGIALGAKVLILDEPTSSLTDREKAVLFENIRHLKQKGVGIVYISHKMDEIFEISDRVFVFRDGANTGEFVTKDITLDNIVQAMIGRSLSNYYPKNTAQKGDVVLKVENLNLSGWFKDISFSVRKGEVLGFYGLVGAGRSEIMETIFGIRKADSGTIYLNGKQVRIRNSVDAVRHRIGFVTEDRKTQGLILKQSCRDNMSLPILPRIRKGWFVNEKETYNIYNKFHDLLDIKSPSSDQEVGNLSGGNQQKIIIGKWLSISPDLIILDEPTRGIDVGAKAEIYKLIVELAEQGKAVIVISSEMPEIMGISDRILTLAGGRLTGEFSETDITEENMIRAITIVDSSEK